VASGVETAVGTDDCARTDGDGTGVNEGAMPVEECGLS
jgi:hypothetical protein